jgi:serine/threonine protein kinase
LSPLGHLALDAPAGQKPYIATYRALRGYSCAPQTRNILLSSSASDPRGVTAKVSDFGLSLKMDEAESHVSNLFHGTVTHMPPEVLLHGCQSKAADV